MSLSIILVPQGDTKHHFCHTSASQCRHSAQHIRSSLCAFGWREAADDHANQVHMQQRMALCMVHDLNDAASRHPVPSQSQQHMHSHSGHAKCMPCKQPAACSHHPAAAALHRDHICSPHLIGTGTRLTPHSSTQQGQTGSGAHPCIVQPCM